MLDACGNSTTQDQNIFISEPLTAPDLPWGFSPNNDSFNDVYLIRNVGPNLDTLLATGWRYLFERLRPMGQLGLHLQRCDRPWDGTNLQGQMLPTGTYFVVFDANGTTYNAAVELRR